MKRTLPVTLTGALLLLAAQAILASLDCNELNCVWCNTPRMKKDCRIRCSQCEKSQIDDQQQVLLRNTKLLVNYKPSWIKPSSEDGSTKSVKSVKEPRKPAPNNVRKSD